MNWKICAEKPSITSAERVAESSSRTSLKVGTTKNNAEKYQNFRALSVQWDSAVCYNKSDLAKKFLF